MKKVRINRANWACGGKFSRPNKLYDGETGGMCCLGFATNQLCKIPKKQLDNCLLPSLLSDDIISYNSVMEKFGFDTDAKLDRFEIFAADVNDDTKMSYARREKLLTNLFAENGIKIEFYGEHKK